MTRHRLAMFAVLMGAVVTVHPLIAAGSLVSPLTTSPSDASATMEPTFVDVVPSDLPGNGTADNPYVITNVSELQAIEDDLDANYTLGADIDASGTAQWNNASGFDPIGDHPNNGQPFNGTFDGAGHTITGLTINRSSEDHVGLFGFVKDGGMIRNVALRGFSVTGSERVGGLVGDNQYGTIQNVSATGTVTGSSQVGGLVGAHRGTIRDVEVAGRVNGSFVGGVVGANRGTIINASATAWVTGSNSVGGFAGSNSGPIRNAVATGRVNGSNFVGGLVGINHDTMIENASATGRVIGTEWVGGLVGSNVGTIRNASATGQVTGSARVGGLVGNNCCTSTVIDAFATGQVNASEQVGGLVGHASNNSTVQQSYWDVNTTGQSGSAGGPNSTGLSTAQMTGTAARTNMTGLAFGTVWRTQSSDYPVLIGLPAGSTTAVMTSGGTVTPAQVNESTTITHDVGFRVANLSKDGVPDVFYVTFPDAVGATALSANSTNVINSTDRSDVPITSSLEQIDGRDNDGIQDTLRFAVSPAGSGTVDVLVNISVDITWPTVANDTGYEIRALVHDSSAGATPLTPIVSVSVRNTTAGPQATLGDVNDDGTINTGDVIEVQRSIVGLSTSSSFSPVAADVNNDGNVNTGDVIQIQRFIVGLSSVVEEP